MIGQLVEKMPRGSVVVVRRGEFSTSGSSRIFSTGTSAAMAARDRDQGDRRQPVDAGSGADEPTGRSPTDRDGGESEVDLDE